MRPQLLVVAHEATRTGAPRVLLELVRHLKAETDIAVAMRLETGGPLENELLALDDGLGACGATAVLVNSALAAAVIDGLPADLRSALYVHEDGDALVQQSPAVLRAITRYDKVYCVSARARAGLETIGVDGARVEVLPPVVLEPELIDATSIGRARRHLGGRDGERIVVGCGEAGWRKGADLFLALAARLRAHTDVRFAWIGIRPRTFARRLDHDVLALGLGDRVVWLGEVDDARPYLAAADVLVMPSRDDPMPLVPIEAAAVGTPTVAFAVGGLAELAADGGALAVPYPDVDGLAGLVTDVLAQPSLRDALVASATDRWHAQQSLDVVGPRFVSAMVQLVGASA